MQDLGLEWAACEDEPEGFAFLSGGSYLRAAVEAQALGPTTRDGIPLSQILNDRPDVFAAYFREFLGPNNDHHSNAWVERVGGVTIHDYANYWYEQHGRWEGYAPRAENAAPDLEGGPRLLPGIEETGRMTADGIPLSQILSDRPDVFRAFFTEYYGANNDRHSSAWVDRVGGETVEDYANYWYERHGRWEGYAPRTHDPVGEAGEDPELSAPPPADDEDPPTDPAAWPDEALDAAVAGEALVGQSLIDPSDGLF